jgi:hypothetical protein
MLKLKTLFILFIVEPLSPRYSDDPSASRLLRLIDTGLVQKVLDNVPVLCLSPFLPCYTSFTTHHALCRSH